MCIPEIVESEIEYGSTLEDVEVHSIYNCRGCVECMCEFWDCYNPLEDFDPCNVCQVDPCTVVCRYQNDLQPVYGLTA